ncbi:MAG: DegT/DnrJ/EryC1/StrS family aminotransferase, partial [Gammaproteobacteria bacterium]|nr:DegT/DnrJ/EryC1/StrS family aminotransferase [Gammaproteobacteria bacterium]
LGGEYLDKKVGSCVYSDITIFSFHPAKMITSGEGGMILTNSSQLAVKIEQLRTHGVIRQAELMTEEPHGDWYYQQISLGFNYRITDIQAALGLSQLKRLDEFVDKRRKLAEQYNQKLKSFPITIPWQSPDTLSSWHIYVIRLNLTKLKINRKTVFERLRQVGIGVHVHYIPVHTQPYYQSFGFKWGDFPQSESYYQEALTLPLFTELTEKQLNFIVQELDHILFN